MALKHRELDKKDVSSVPEMGKFYKNFKESDGNRKRPRACSRLEKHIKTLLRNRA
jgi:hypothetical protein